MSMQVRKHCWMALSRTFVRARIDKRMNLPTLSFYTLLLFLLFIFVVVFLYFRFVTLHVASAI